jgi:lysophospholipase L1-like esterase
MPLIAYANTATPNMTASKLIRTWVSEELKEDSSVILRTNNNVLYNYTGSFPFTTQDFNAEKDAGLWVAVVKGSANDFTTEIKNEIAKFEDIIAALASGFIYPIPQAGNTASNEPAPTVNGSYRAIAGTYTEWLDVDSNAIIVPSTTGFIHNILVSGIGGSGVVCKLDSIDLNITKSSTPTKASTDVFTSGGAFDSLNKDFTNFTTVSDVSDITTNGLTINSLIDGSFDVTINRLNPWVTLNTANYEFILNNNIRWMVIAKDADSILAITMDNTANSGKLFRFTNEGGITSIATTLANVNFTSGNLITAQRSGNVITIKENGVLKITFDYTSYISANPEFSDPVFGNIIKADGVQLTGLKSGTTTSVSLKERVTILEATEETYTTSIASKLDANKLKAVALVDTDDVNSYTGKRVGDYVFGKLNKSVTTFEPVTNIADFTANGLTINSVTNGDFNVTRGGDPYPWLYAETLKMEFTYMSSIKYIVVARTDTTVIEIGIGGGGAKGAMYRFTTTDLGASLGLVTSHSANAINNGEPVRVERVGTIISIYYNNVLKYSYDYSESVEAEWANPVFGVIYDSALVFNGVKIEKTTFNSLGQRVTFLETNATNLETNATNNNQFKDLTMGSLGDSIMSPSTLQNHIKTAIGLTSFQNLGVSGSGLVHGGGLGLTKMTELTAGHKIIISNYGTNDFGNSISFGVEANITAGTWFGALDVYFKYLRENNLTSFIFQTTIMHRDWQSGGQVAGLVDNNGKSIEDYNNAMKLKAAKYGIVIIDLYQLMGISKENITTYTTDRLHVNALGYKRMAGIVINKIIQHAYFLD